MFRSLTKHASAVLERISDPFFETIGQGSLSAIVGEAVEVAVTAGSPTTEAEHLLLAMAKHRDSPQLRILVAAGLDCETIKHALEHELEQSLEAVGMSRSALEIPPATNRQGTRPEFGPSFRRAVQRAAELANEDYDSTAVEPPHLLLGVLAAEVGTVPRALTLAGIDREELIERVRQTLTANRPMSYDKRVALINAFEPELELQSDAELRERMDVLRKRARDGESPDALLPECFAIVREIGKRAVGMRHFDVQLIGGMALHEGRIAEMQTGEGKTLTATLAVVLNSLATCNHGLDSDRPEGRGIHVVTVNDYLAHRDAEWMGPIYKALDMSVGVLQNLQSNEERQQAYACEVVYGTHTEFGVDYLRDNMALELSERVQRGHAFAIVDEVDKILIDEACSPLVISGVREESKTVATITYQKYFRLYEKLSGMTGTALTEATEFMKIYELPVVQVPTNRPMIRADRNDRVYKTREGKWNAVVNEVVARHENGQPVLVGTISVEDSELLGERLTQRGIPHTVLANTKPEHAAPEAEIVAEAGQPGAVTIVTNMAGRGVDIKLGGDPEHIAHQQLAREGVYQTDAEEYARRMSSVSPEVRRRVREGRERVIAAGGLFICATERHESRRLDDQLRGRSGRQGDPGESRFYLSAEDDLVRLFAGDRIYRILDRLGGIDEDGNEEPIEAGMLSKQIGKAQKMVEEQSFLQRQKVFEEENQTNQ